MRLARLAPASDVAPVAVGEIPRPEKAQTTDEIFPIGAGIILGVLIACEVRVLRTLWARVSMVALAGVAATLLSGEYNENWGFVLVDIGEVGLAAWVSASLARLLAPRLRSVGGGPQNSSGD